MIVPQDFQQFRKRALVCGSFAAALSAVTAFLLNSGSRIGAFVIIAVQVLLVVLAVFYLVKMKSAGKTA